MYGELRWTCRQPECAALNMTRLDTADRRPRDLACYACGRLQNARATLGNHVAPMWDFLGIPILEGFAYRDLTDADLEMP